MRPNPKTLPPKTRQTEDEMRLVNTETPTYAGNAGTNGEPAKVEKLAVVDADGNEVASFDKNINGVTTLTVGGVKVYRALLAQTGTNAPVATVLENTLGGAITVRELEQAAAAKRPDATSFKRNPNIMYFETQLRSALGAKTSISERGGKGTITVQFHSPDELADIVKKIIEE
jgi:hypothetical protein